MKKLKAEIEQIILETVQAVGPYHAGTEEAAAAIAERVVSLDEYEAETAALGNRVFKAEARLAEMQDALVRCTHDEYYINHGTPEYLAKRLRRVNEIVAEALAAGEGEDAEEQMASD